jgi:hypothetical protein
MPHVDFMIDLTNRLHTEVNIQTQINELRAKHPRNQAVQLKLDRHQEIVNKRVEEIRESMAHVAICN